MSLNIVLRLKNAVENYDPYFIQRRNVAVLLGLSSLQKIIAALRMLAYGNAAENLDEYVTIGESISLENLKRFAKAIFVTFSDEYLRSPNTKDITRLLAIGDQRHFLGMLGSIDYMHWRWKNCPSPWHNMYNGHFHEPTIILEAVASYDLWIWHAFFGLLEFGVLQSHFAIVRGAARLWDQNTLKDIMTACIIMHNMVIEEEQHNERCCHQIHNFDKRGEIPNIEPTRECSLGLTPFIQSHIRIRDKQTHCRLQADLVEHLRQQHGGE
ncbi:hypothetical protein CerSpe_161620 [Prunus speciosa]